MLLGRWMRRARAGSGRVRPGARILPAPIARRHGGGAPADGFARSTAGRAARTVPGGDAGHEKATEIEGRMALAACAKIGRSAMSCANGFRAGPERTTVEPRAREKRRMHTEGVPSRARGAPRRTGSSSPSGARCAPGASPDEPPRPLQASCRERPAQRRLAAHSHVRRTSHVASDAGRRRRSAPRPPPAGRHHRGRALRDGARGPSGGTGVRRPQGSRSADHGTRWSSRRSSYARPARRRRRSAGWRANGRPWKLVHAQAHRGRAGARANHKGDGTANGRGWWLGASRWTTRPSPRGRISKTIRRESREPVR